MEKALNNQPPIREQFLLTKIFHYYDFPLVFAAAHKTKRIAVFCLLNENPIQYIGKRLSQPQITSFVQGQRDLRTLYLENESPFLIGAFSEQTQNLTVSTFEGDTTEDILPESGLFCPDFPNQPIQSAEVFQNV